MTTQLSDPQKVQVAYIFSDLLLDYCGTENFYEAIKLNIAEVSDSVCHSHDFCDANMVMLKAFEDYGFDVPESHLDDKDFQNIWNDVWHIAVKMGFFGELIEEQRF